MLRCYWLCPGPLRDATQGCPLRFSWEGYSQFCGQSTGSGKTLPIALNILLDDPARHPITMMLSPLKRLQVTQESDFNSQYSIPTVVINEDTPREDSWWTVCIFSPTISRTQFQSHETSRRMSGIKHLVLLDMLGFLS